MIEIYTPAVRVVVVASLLLAIATMTFVTARAAGAAGACLSGRACADDGCEMVISTRRCAAYAVDFTAPATPLAWAGLMGPALRKIPG